MFTAARFPEPDDQQPSASEDKTRQEYAEKDTGKISRIDEQRLQK